MSNTPFEVVAVKSVTAHPDADRLDIVEVLDTQFVGLKGELAEGDLCVYFPPDMLLPNDIAEEFGIANYLKEAVYPGDNNKTKCRIGAIRLRGVPSFGFGLRLDELGIYEPAGVDVTKALGGVKYQPPVTYSQGDTLPSPPSFHCYTDIQHYYRYASAMPGGLPVRITEKIHGTNSRVGLINTPDGYEWACGTRRRRVEQLSTGYNPSLYWSPLTESLRALFSSFTGDSNNVIVFGELYGGGVQSMDYGTERGKGYCVFDISVNGTYLDWNAIQTACRWHEIETAPLLYSGPFSPELIKKYSSGPTTLAEPGDIDCKFKGREGIVITPLEEQYAPLLGSRLILKAVSPDYYEAGLGDSPRGAAL